MKKLNFPLKFSLMNKCIYLFIYLWSSISYSQITHTCNFVPDADMLDVSKYSNRYQIISNTDGPYVFNIRFHGVHETDGSDLHNINEARFLRSIARLNEVYNPHNIFFKYRGYDILNDSDYVNTGSLGTGTLLGTQIRDKFVSKGMFDYSSINIFVTHGFASGGAGTPWCVFYSTTNPDVTPIGSRFYDYLVPHEVGHRFGLMHIESRTIIDYQIISDNLPQCMNNSYLPSPPQMVKPNMPQQQTSIQIENVTRDTNNLAYNADIGGDFVADTQACFEGYLFNYCRNYIPTPEEIAIGYYGLGNLCSNFDIWSPHPDVVDFVGEQYACTVLETRNIMGQGFSTSFTLGQGKRMREYIASNMVTYRQTLSLLDDETADMSVLYEPFALGAVGVSNPVLGTAYSKTMTPNETNTGVNVWNCGPFVARYQPGFNYEFTDTAGQITNQTIYQQYNANCNGFIGVKIPILGSEVIQTMEPMCFSSFEPYIKGEIKSLDYLGSIYITIQELDAIKASNPDLYNELQSGDRKSVV